MFKYENVKNKIMLKYNFMNFSEIEIEQTIISVIDKYNISGYDDSKIYNAVSNYFLELINKTVTINDYTYINNYIKKYCVSLTNTKERIKFLNNLVNLIESANIEITPELYLDIIDNNTLLKDIMKEILKTYKDIDKISTTDAVKSFIEVYTYTSDEYSIVRNDTGYVEFNSNKDTDLVKAYLNEIGKYDLLTPEEEISLAIAYKDNGDRHAREKLINSNLRLVVSIAKKYVGGELNFLDVIEEGNMGLIIGIDKFNPHKGFRLSTYVTWWIKQNIVRSMYNGYKTIRIPVHMGEKINAYKKFKNELISRLGRTPSLEELSRELGVSATTIKNLEKYSQDVVSLNAEVGTEGDNDSELGDFIKDTDPTPDETLGTIADKEFVEQCLDSLPQRQKLVLKYRYGIDEETSYSLEATAQKLYEVGETDTILTRERIRQIEAKAFRNIRRILARKSPEYKEKIYKLR